MEDQPQTVIYLSDGSEYGVEMEIESIGLAIERALARGELLRIGPDAEINPRHVTCIREPVDETPIDADELTAWLEREDPKTIVYMSDGAELGTTIELERLRSLLPDQGLLTLELARGDGYVPVNSLQITRLREAGSDD